MRPRLVEKAFEELFEELLDGTDENKKSKDLGTEGLKYELNENKTSYTVTGIGTVTSNSIVIPATYNGKPVTEIDVDAFNGCLKFNSVTIGNNVIKIGYGAFYGCPDLKRVYIPDSVQEIEDCAFYDCDDLEEVTIGKDMILIRSKAFWGCDKLEKVYYLGSQEDWDSISIDAGNESLINADIIFK